MYSDNSLKQGDYKMKYIVFIIAIVLLAGSAGAGHMFKNGGQEGRQGYTDNRMEGYKYFRWGMNEMGYGCGDNGYGSMGQHNILSGMTGFGMGPGMWGYDAGRDDKFLDNTAELRRELHIKQFDYNEALRNREITSDELIKMETEILEIEMNIKEKWWNKTDE